MTTIPAHFRMQTESHSHPAATITLAQARFTVLTERMMRMEYSPTGQFEDRPSQIFWFRHQPKPQFTVRRGKNLEIITPHVHLKYRLDLPFTPQNLTVKLLASGKIWKFGDSDQGNLKGTARTLDGVNGITPLEPGLVSRQGWVVVDDSRGLVFNAAGWLEPRQAPEGTCDLYFFGCGQDYAACLRDYCRVSGPTPLVPRFVLGNWWSRYWMYTQPELGSLVEEFKAHKVPLSVCIIDMDWHITQTGNACSGWTGYTWNKKLFPDPYGFIRWLHQQGLKTALNLHPAEGVHPHEQQYPAMAKALGVDIERQEPVKFDIEQPAFVKPYFEILHHPMEQNGVDFWWMDWQQGNPTELPGLNLLWWINHVHFYDLARHPQKRGMVFSRWGGLGNHRYPIGFSGDTMISWQSLSFQPYFTATAANVGYGWWSHDIGGHMDGIEDGELYTRWVQFGAFSPILRLHCTQNPFHERRPWGYDAAVEKAASHALRLRHALIPYLYSMAWRNHREGEVLVRPMYHLAPEHEQAYACPNQYAFGSELVVAPFISPRDADTRLSRAVAWLPAGDWFGFFDDTYYPGNAWQAIYGGLEDIPVFARAGALVPLGPLPEWGGVDNPAELTLHVFPGADNRLALFEDDGSSQAYLSGQYAITPLSQEWQDTRQVVRIGAAEGMQTMPPARRTWKLVFHACHEPDQVRVSLNGWQITPTVAYDEQTACLYVEGITLTPADDLKVELSAAGSLLVRQEKIKERLHQLLRAFRLGNDVKKSIFARLDEFINHPERLATYLVTLTPSQRRALLEVLSGLGMEHVTNTGEELIVMWNNRQERNATFTVSIEHRDIYEPHKRLSLKTGVLPPFQVIRPREEFQDNPALVMVDFHGLLKIKVTHQTDDIFPRPKTGME